MKKIFIILFCLLITSPAYAGTTPLFDLWKFFKKGKIVKSAKLIKIPSYNSGPFPNEFMSLKDGSYKKSPVEIDALMVFPKKGEEPFPVLVFNHASGGSALFSNEWFKFDRLMARQFLKKNTLLARTCLPEEVWLGAYLWTLVNLPLFGTRNCFLI